MSSESAKIIKNDENNFVYKDQKVLLSELLTRVNADKRIKNLKNIKIFATKSITFDIDYKIFEERYLTHSPDLIIISPCLIAEKKITIDLSCNRIPPTYKFNAESGKTNGLPGIHGVDGQPGLPGYNGGNLFIFAKEISQSIKSLEIITNGGKGGPGQNGKF